MAHVRKQYQFRSGNTPGKVLGMFGPDELIEEAEFDVIEASNADEAIAILEARPDITVLFTDIQMPGSMDGLKLAAAVKGRWPPIKIVATSGLVNVRPDDLPEGGRFLPKPL
jgi:CheY-like chemotaxis protein